MPRSLSLATAIEANALSSGVPFLCLIDVEVVDRVTGVVVMELNIVRNSEDIAFQGKTYTAGNFDVSIKYVSGSPGEVNLSVTDYTRTLQQLMEANGGAVGSNVTLYIVNSANLDQGAEIEEFFQITSASSSDYKQNFTLGAENTLMLTFPRRRQSKNFCNWRYKSTECGYTGSKPSCDLTLQGDNGCESHSNSLNYGAYPGMNSNGYRYG